MSERKHQQEQEPRVIDGDLEFMSDTRAAITRESHFLASGVLYLTAIFLVIAVIWAAYATLDEVAIGTGRVIPSSQVQVIQNLEGGILAELRAPGAPGRISGVREAIHVPGTLAGEGTAWSVSLSQTFEWPGRLALRKAGREHPIEKTGAELRAMMPWISAGKQKVAEVSGG